jgi:hypothetical protein
MALENCFFEESKVCFLLVYYNIKLFQVRIKVAKPKNSGNDIQYKSGMVLNNKEMSNKHEVNGAILTGLETYISSRASVPLTKEF